MNDPVEKPRPETLELLTDLARQGPSEQIKASDAVDTKIFQAFATGSILIGLVTLGDVDRGCVSIVFVSVAVAALAGLAIAAIWALWSRRFRVPISSHQLWMRYWNESPDDIRHAYLDDLASAYAENEAHIASKHRALRVVLILLLVEVAAISATLIASLV